MGIDITALRIRIGRFGPSMGYISTLLKSIHFPSLGRIFAKMLGTMVLLTFLLK